MGIGPEPGLSGTRRLEEIARLVDSVVDYAIFLLDPAGHVLTWTPGARRAKGYEAEEIIGKHFSIFYTEADRARRHPDHELEVATREGRFEEEGWRVRKDGTQFWANVVITALWDDTGGLRGFGKVTRDLTERRRNHQELLVAQETLERSNAALEAFASAAAHDLREPIRTAQGLGRLLRARLGDALPAKDHEIGLRLERTLERASHVVEHLLSFARSNSKELELGRVDVAELVHDACDSLGSAIAEREAILDVEVGDLVVRADRTLVSLVIQNLVANALKFSVERPRVEIAARRTETLVRIAVRDHGIGIAASDQERVFESFTRLESNDQSGSGLGLAIARRTVERHGGTMGVESAEGGGSTFWLTLPAA